MRASARNTRNCVMFWIYTKKTRVKELTPTLIIDCYELFYLVF